MPQFPLVPDATCQNHHKIAGINSIDVEKCDIFNFGIFHYEIPPDKVSENDFEYLESKIPSYYGLYEDHIDVDDTRIICKVPGEAATRVSEIVGIAIGLKASKVLFQFKRKDIQKIGVSKKREKRLDFKVDTPTLKIDIETKGTTGAGTVASMIGDIHAKKTGKPNGISRFGFVTLLRKLSDNDQTKIFVTDPDGELHPPSFKGVFNYIAHYCQYLSFALDNSNYNRVVRKLLAGKRYNRRLINTDRIRYRFSFKGRVYLGQCFDKRLQGDLISQYGKDVKSIDALYSVLTKQIGKEKYFLGVDYAVLNAINLKDESFLDSYESNDSYSTINQHEYFEMSDGALFIKSTNGSLPEMERQFTETDVKSRLRGIISFDRREPHLCGAPCRSREKEGDPCQIMTYRDYCHFHR